MKLEVPKTLFEERWILSEYQIAGDDIYEYNGLYGVIVYEDSCYYVLELSQ